MLLQTNNLTLYRKIVILKLQLIRDKLISDI